MALPSVAVAELRVVERVSHGGHDIPLPDIARRFHRSLNNLFAVYTSLVDRTVCFFNGGPSPSLVFTQEGSRRVVAESSILRSLEERRRHGSTG